MDGDRADDIADFVAARWGGLEAVALVATLDPEQARAVTAEALAEVVAEWDEVAERGAPTAAARSALLRRVARLQPAGGQRGASPSSSALREAVADEGSTVPSSLFVALGHESPLVRAALAAGHTWQLTPDEVGHAAGRGGSTRPPDVTGAHDRLRNAHRDALAADGLFPMDHRLDGDLADLLDRLAAAVPEPADPVGLVADRRSGGVRRRALVLGAGGMAVLGVGGWAVLGSGGRSTPAAAPSASGAPSLPPTAREWNSTATWPPRGGLVDDPRVRQLVSGRDSAEARLVYADDVADLRVVIAVAPRVGFAEGRIQVWTGRSGADPLSLTLRDREQFSLFGAGDLVAAELPGAAPSRVLVLARPSLSRAAVSNHVTPLPSGELERTFAGFALANGIGSVALSAPGSLATRLRCGNYDGLVSVIAQFEAPGPGADFVEQVSRSVSRYTAVPVDELEAEVVLDRTLGPEELTFPGSPRPSRAQVVLVRTPSGGVARQVNIRQEESDEVLFWQPIAVVPAAAALEPLLLGAQDLPVNRGDFVVLAPGGGWTARLFAPGGEGRPVSRAVRLRDGAAAVSAVDVTGGQTPRLLVRDRAGRTLVDAVPTARPGLWDQPALGP